MKVGAVTETGLLASK